MIYLIGGKYYVNISPSIYSEISASLKGEEVILKPMNKKIEVNQSETITVISLRDIKEKLKSSDIPKMPKRKNKSYE